MNYIARPIWIAAALAVAGAVPVAHAAKPSPTPKELKAMADQARDNHHFFKQPETMAEAAATQVQMPDGTVAIAVPTELWNTLSVKRDASGKLQILESDGTNAPVATVK
ncbi:MAG: hypothetical protein Q8L45_00730 [Xanthomonadaceae bacterium]|nr:hypothetical protein [Xanthomonadaceae bacterium]MDZ4376651.1 hypothetical protein [Xanthomonadaceae bacterium]